MLPTELAFVFASSFAGVIVFKHEPVSTCLLQTGSRQVFVLVQPDGLVRTRFCLLFAFLRAWCVVEIAVEIIAVEVVGLHKNNQTKPVLIRSSGIDHDDACPTPPIHNRS